MLSFYIIQYLDVSHERNVVLPSSVGNTGHKYPPILGKWAIIMN